MKWGWGFCHLVRLFLDHIPIFRLSHMVLDAGSLAGVLSQMHILSEFMSRLGIAEGIEGDLLPADHFDLIGGSGIAAYVAIPVIGSRHLKS